MTAFGFIVFGDIPSWWTITGATIVILAGLYLLARERIAEEHARKKKATPSVGTEFEPPK
jgi:drug/metabolite transporter (DMT)-like permease